MNKKGFYFFVLMSMLQLNSMENYDISPSVIIDNPCGLLEQGVVSLLEYAPKLIAIEEKHAPRNENNVQAWLKEMKDLHKEYTQRCPLHLVLMTEDYYNRRVKKLLIIKEYPLSRKYYPEIRNAYEEKISKLLLEALNRNRSDFSGAVLTHFGSELFSVLRTITKVLKKKTRCTSCN